MKKILFLAAITLGAGLGFADNAEATTDPVLKIYTMPVTITDCPSCENKKVGMTCPQEALNCDVGSYTSPEGKVYDARYYPGVRVRP